MRPADHPRTAIAECFACGRRERGESSGVCPACGGRLHNIARPRDR